MNNTINYYGCEYNYIHLKFGDARKMYNFTKEFIEKYPVFCEHYKNYYYENNNTLNYFKNAYSIIKYIEDFQIPIQLYFNFTDEPATTEEALKWWTQNNTIYKNLDIK